MREAQQARNNRAEIVRELSWGRVTRRDLIKMGLFTAAGYLAPIRGLSPFAPSVYGQMLTGMTDVKGSAGYVAIEKVSGTLKGRTGTFILQHTGTMNRGVPQLIITVVPDSGTGQLAGITGDFKIIIAEGKHSYEFEYTLPDSH